MSTLKAPSQGRGHRRSPSDDRRQGETNHLGVHPLQRRTSIRPTETDAQATAAILSPSTKGPLDEDADVYARHSITISQPHTHTSKQVLKHPPLPLSITIPFPLPLTTPTIPHTQTPRSPPNNPNHNLPALPSRNLPSPPSSPNPPTLPLLLPRSLLRQPPRRSHRKGAIPRRSHHMRTTALLLRRQCRCRFKPSI